MLQPSTWGWAGAPRRGTADRRPCGEIGAADCCDFGYSPGPHRPPGALEHLVGPDEPSDLVEVAWSSGGRVKSVDELS